MMKGNPRQAQATIFDKKRRPRGAALCLYIQVTAVFSVYVLPETRDKQNARFFDITAAYIVLSQASGNIGRHLPRYIEEAVSRYESYENG
jgi:hypothetical protein